MDCTLQIFLCAVSSFFFVVVVIALIVVGNRLSGKDGWVAILLGTIICVPEGGAGVG